MSAVNPSTTPEQKPSAPSCYSGGDCEPEGRVVIELSTLAASRLVTGRPPAADKPYILGLFGFADRLRGIWDAARAGDPYARWWLLKIEDACRHSMQRMDEAHAAIEKTLGCCDAFQIDAAANRSCKQIELNFACPYAYQGARLLKLLDALVMALSTAIQIGECCAREAATVQRGCERTVRHSFSVVNGFHSLGVTSQVIEVGGELAVDAAALMGQIPSEILSEQRWPTLLDRNSVDDPDRACHGQV